MDTRISKLPAAQPEPAQGKVPRRLQFRARRSTLSAPPFKTMSAYPYVAPITQQIKWQGADLALAQLRIYLNEIKHELQPPRADIISKAAEDGLKVVSLLEQWVAALPPGTA